MSGIGSTTRAERSATLPGSAATGLDEKHKRQMRQVSHRPHASHHFHIHRHPVKEGAQQLGAEIVNFLNPTRSVGPSAAPSRSISRRPSGEIVVNADQGTPEARGAGAATPAHSNVSWRDVERVRHSLKNAQDQLATDHKLLSEFALSSSRKVDSGIYNIQDGMATVSQELDSLRQISHAANTLLSEVTHDRIPAASTRHEKQLLALQKTYDNIERVRLGMLEKRLTDAQERVQAMKQRMAKVRQDVDYWDSRDTRELQRSQQRHVVFWVFLAALAFLLLLLFGPWKLVHQRVGNLTSELPLLDSVGAGQSRSEEKPASTHHGARGLEQADREGLPLKMLDEL